MEDCQKRRVSRDTPETTGGGGPLMLPDTGYPSNNPTPRSFIPVASLAPGRPHRPGGTLVEPAGTVRRG
jgi:hypothetical protein